MGKLEFGISRKSMDLAAFFFKVDCAKLHSNAAVKIIKLKERSIFMKACYNDCYNYVSFQSNHSMNLSSQKCVIYKIKNTAIVGQVSSNWVRLGLILTAASHDKALRSRVIGALASQLTTNVGDTYHFCAILVHERKP